MKKAKPGDIVSFDFGAMDAVRDHVGIVDHVEGDRIWCIEGNTSKKGSQSNGGMVCLQPRPYTWICSAVRPAYKKVIPVDAKPYTGTFPTLPERGWFEKGDRSVQVRHLQRLLNWACDESLDIDGDLGSVTAGVIKDYQRMYGLEVDGQFGTKCLEKARKIRK